MIISLDTATPTCRISVHDSEQWHDHEWDAGRKLASELLTYLHEALGAHDAGLKDIAGIIAYQGPGSFTGLRIGLTVMNTLARAEAVPIVGMTGDDWQRRGLDRLRNGENDELVMPEYGGEPNITTPRK